jgi:hypothetical protein
MEGATCLDSDCLSREPCIAQPIPGKEAVLYDILSICHQAGKPPSEAEERSMVLVEKPQERLFPAPLGIADKLPGRFPHV